MNCNNLIMRALATGAGFLFLCFAATAQTAEKQPVLEFQEMTHDFGTIGETDGYAEHLFYFTNTGQAPLVVNRVQASCGCTQPEWTREPIEPGKKGVVILSYNPKGRLGAFDKTATVYTNEEGGFKRHRLTIRGTVVAKPRDPNVACKDTVGGVAIEEKNMHLTQFQHEGDNFQVKYIKNLNNKSVYLTYDETPPYIVVAGPESLLPDWHNQIRIVLNGKNIGDKRGRYHETIRMTVRDSVGVTLGSDHLTLTVNYIDDFANRTPLQAATPPACSIENTQLMFGVVKSGFLGFGGISKRQFTIKNTGKSDLILHSVSSDLAIVHLPSASLQGKHLKPGESLTVEVSLKAKELTGDIDTDIYVVCNDPNGPVRRIRVAAEKSK